MLDKQFVSVGYSENVKQRTATVEQDRKTPDFHSTITGITKKHDQAVK